MEIRICIILLFCLTEVVKFCLFAKISHTVWLREVRDSVKDMCIPPPIPVWVFSEVEIEHCYS